MAGYIIEGPDGSGKSFTAEAIASAVGLSIYHSGGPPKTPEEMLERAARLLQMDNIIFDRFPVISDTVYGPIIRNELLFTPFWLTRIRLPVIYCRPSRETILKSELTTKPHKSAEHLAKVKQRINLIINAYDQVMTKINHVRFNRDTQRLEDFIQVLREERPCAGSMCVLEKKT